MFSQLFLTKSISSIVSNISNELSSSITNKERPNRYHQDNQNFHDYPLRFELNFQCQIHRRTHNTNLL